MTLQQFKTRILLLEACNSVATALYSNYIFFYLRSRFGIGSAGNLLFCSLNGFIYMFAAWYGGNFGQRRGYFKALRIGFAVMALALVAASFAESAALQVAGMAVWTLGMCFTWPTLEGLISEREDRRRLPRMIGMYNVVWASGAAFAYFTGGALVEKLGWKCIFWIPAGLHLVQLILLPAVAKVPLAQLTVSSERNATPKECSRPDPRAAKLFLNLAWIANPFAYIAMNTAIPLIPDLALRLHLSPATAGIFCSTWMFSRLGTFILLGLWPGWHYRFGLLLGAYLILIITFAGLLLLPNIAWILVDQLLFGFCSGLIYYSSLFYSMDVGEEKGAHGGIHEAVIGAGICVGPALGFTALHFFPQYKNSSVWSVTTLLGVGLCALLYIKQSRSRPSAN